MKRLDKKRVLIGIYALMVISIVSYLLITNFVKKPEEISLSYASFVQNVNDGQIEKVYLSEAPKIKGVMAGDQVFITDNPRLDNLKETLLINDVIVEEVNEQFSSTNLLTFVLLIGAFIGIAFYLSKKGMHQTSKEYDKMSTVDFSTEKDSKVSFSNIAGNEEAKENMIELVDFLKYPDKYARYGARMPKGVILYGPPGTGKTLMAKALASEAGVDFIAVSGSDFVQVYAGLGAGRIRSLFNKAREKGKCVIFIDEIDAIGKKRDRGGLGGSDESDRTLNALLTEMSGFKGSEGIIIMAATNRLDILDDALLRPGRFDRQIEVGLPDLKARQSILRLYAKDRPMAPSVNMDGLAQQTVYFSGAKIENLINEAAIYAAKESAEYITEVHLDRAFYTVVAGEAKKDRSGIKELDRKVTAYHEAGHATITRLLCPENKVTKVTIIPSTKGAGGFSMNIPPDRMYHTKIDMLNNIKVALGGRVVEEIIFGEENITTGASNDIQKATEILTAMIKQFGMHEKVGMLNYDILLGHQGGIDGELRQLILDEMKRLYEETKLLLECNINLVKEIAVQLLTKETLNEMDIDHIFSNYKEELEVKNSFLN